MLRLWFSRLYPAACGSFPPSCPNEMIHGLIAPSLTSYYHIWCSRTHVSRLSLSLFPFSLHLYHQLAPLSPVAGCCCWLLLLPLLFCSNNEHQGGDTELRRQGEIVGAFFKFLISEHHGSKVRQQHHHILAGGSIAPGELRGVGFDRVTK